MLLGKGKAHRRAFLLFLQTPSLRYPEGVKKLHYNLKRDGNFGGTGGFTVAFPQPTFLLL
jgi:hypothetical protein